MSIQNSIKPTLSAEKLINSGISEKTPNQILNQKSFKEVFSEQKINSLLNRAISTGAVNPAELIQAQLAVGKYQLKVELVSKCAEGANATLRKIQQNN